MKTYLISLFIIVVLISVVQIILPKGKITSAATCVLSFAMALCFINALGGISFDFASFNFKGETTEKSTSVFNEYVDSELENYYKSAFISLLKDNDLICEKVNVEICNKEIEKTEVYLSNLVFDEKNAHININVIADYVAEKIGVDRSKVVVYG